MATAPSIPIARAPICATGVGTVAAPVEPDAALPLARELAEAPVAVAEPAPDEPSDELGAVKVALDTVKEPVGIIVLLETRVVATTPPFEFSDNAPETEALADMLDVDGAGVEEATELEELEEIPPRI
jgi:hypothetical protein